MATDGRWLVSTQTCRACGRSGLHAFPLADDLEQPWTNRECARCGEPASDVVGAAWVFSAQDVARCSPRAADLVAAVELGS